MSKRSIFSHRERRTDAHTSNPTRDLPCRCGSGRKYKNCHLSDDREIEEKARPKEAKS